MDNVKVCFQMIVFKDDWFLEYVLRNVSAIGPIVVTEGPVQFWANQGFSTSTDRTNEILEKYVPRDRIVHGVWPEKDEMVNAAINLIPKDTTHIWHVDADELYHLSEMQQVLSMISENEYDSVSFMPYSFYGGFRYYMTGFEENFEMPRIQRYYPGCKWATHRPPTILAPDGQPWKKHRHLSNVSLSKMGIRLYHYSYVMPMQIKQKIWYYRNRAMDRTIPDYFDQVYRRWVAGDRIHVESRFAGVHDWLPAIRGACYTTNFEGTHPKIISDNMDTLLNRFREEWEECR